MSTTPHAASAAQAKLLRFVTRPSLEPDLRADTNLARRHDVSYAAKRRARHVRCRFHRVRIDDVQRVETDLELPLRRQVELLARPQIQQRNRLLRLRTERLEPQRDRRLLAQRRTAERIGGTEHVGPLAEGRAEPLDDVADTDAVGHAVIAVELRLPAPRVVDRKEIIVRAQRNCTYPAMVLGRGV